MTFVRNLAAPAALALGALLASCGVGQDILVGKVPPVIAYESPVTFTVGVAASRGVQSTGGAVTSFTVSPSLPAGLALDAASGALGGVALVAAAAADYTVIAEGPGGRDTALVSLAVVSVPVDPGVARPQIAYASPVTDSVGRPAGHAVVSTGGPTTGFAISPALPAGLVLDAATGRIAGTPAEPSAALAYSVIAFGPGGRDTALIVLAVVANPAFARPQIAYASPVTDTVGRPASHAVISTGGSVTSYKLMTDLYLPGLPGPDPTVLPPGMILNASTGSISGVPTTVINSVTYTIIASGPGGNDTATITLAVVDMVPAPVPLPSPLAYWDFNEGDGAILTDRTTGGRHAIINGAAWVTGIDGTALSFDGSNDFAESNSSLPDMAKQTMMAWVYVESIRESYIFGEGDDASGNDNTLSIRPTTGFFLYRTHGGNPTDQHPSRTALQTGRWYHLAGVSTGDSVLIYMDGRRDTVYTGTYNLNGFHHNLQFGRFNDGRGGRLYFHGRLDEVKVFDQALTPDQIRTEWLRNLPILILD